MVPIDSLYIGIRHFPIKQHDHRPLTIYSSATIDALQTTGDRQTISYGWSIATMRPSCAVMKIWRLKDSGGS